MTDETYSKHYDEFRARVESYRAAGVSVPQVVWTAILDLGNQIATVRHQVVEMHEAGEILDAKLFGWQSSATPDFADGGIFGALTRKMDDIKLSGETVIVAQTKEMKDDLVWIKRIAGVFVTIGAALTVYFIAHSLGWNP